MKLLHGFQNSPMVWQGGYVAIGNLDGVHRGHQQIVSTVVRRAREAQVPSVLLTFNPHPIKILRPEFAPPNLMTLESKATMLGELGIDFVIAYPTDRALLTMDPLEFFRVIICDRLAARGLVEGPNFYFGKDRAGDVTTLRDLCDEHGLSLEIVKPVLANGEVVSSSRIRRALADGEIRLATQMLGHTYALTGVVRSGAGRGRGIGFPTANLEDISTLVPANGVYAATTTVNDRDYNVALNIGPNPTFGEHAQKVEAHLLDFDGELYDETLTLQLRHHIRAGRRFDSADELVQQVRRDVERIRELLSQD